jgi:hypothetical protein
MLVKAKHVGTMQVNSRKSSREAKLEQAAFRSPALGAAGTPASATCRAPDDSSTASFMKAFYGRRSNGADSALALRAAMVELRERNPRPYYWAPFILVG